MVFHMLRKTTEAALSVPRLLHYTKPAPRCILMPSWDPENGRYGRLNQPRLSGAKNT